MFYAMPRNLGERYSPLYDLSALGAGGLAVSFFMYLLFWVPHPNAVVPVFEDIAGAFLGGNASEALMVSVAWVGIAFFGLLHFRLLIWNRLQRRIWERTEAYTALRSGNAETQLLAIPLTLAMSLNVGFILGLVFVPGLWSVVEYLFPPAMGGFLAIRAYAFKLLSGLQLVLGFRAMLEHGVDAEAVPSLWIAIPIVTVLAIATMRQGHGLHDALGFGSEGAFPWLTKLLALQLVFALLGFAVLRRTGYFRRYVFGDRVSPGAWALVCPGVGLSVMLQFWVNKALLPAGLVVKFAPAYWGLTALALLLQAATVWLAFRLGVRHFGSARVAVSAE